MIFVHEAGHRLRVQPSGFQSMQKVHTVVMFRADVVKKVLSAEALGSKVLVAKEVALEQSTTLPNFFLRQKRSITLKPDLQGSAQRPQHGSSNLAPEHAQLTNRLSNLNKFMPGVTTILWSFHD